MRDCLHPRDLAPLLERQFAARSEKGDRPRIVNVAGGAENTMSLAQLSAWCAERFGARPVSSEPANRPFDVPWLVLDSTLAAREWAWNPATPVPRILEEIAEHAEQNPGWLELSRA